MKLVKYTNEIHGLISTIIESSGFNVNKKRDTYTRKESDNVTEFEILAEIRRNKFSQHLRFSYTDKKVSKFYQLIENQIRFSKNLPKLNITRPTYSITDWLFILEKYDLSDIEIWFYTFPEDTRITDFKSSYEKIADLVILLSNDLKDIDFLLNILYMEISDKRAQMIFCVLAVYRPNKLKEFYTNIKNKTISWDNSVKDKVDFFYNLVEKEVNKK